MNLAHGWSHEFPCVDMLSFINTHGRLSEPEAAHLTAQIVDALSFAHGLGFIHRDIKVPIPVLSETYHTYSCCGYLCCAR
jgi:serine/threonine protein kinase